MSDDKETIGVLRSSFELTIHSKEAQKLIEGRVLKKDSEKDKKYTINGLELYSRRLNTIWHRIRNDDPYAEMILIEIERRLERAHRKISAATEQAESMLKKSPPGISISISNSTKPVKISLNDAKYYTVHAKLAAVLVADFDFLIRKLKSCIDIGQLTKTQYKKRVERLSTLIRGVLIAPSVYKNMNISRQDILQSNEKGTVAIEKFGLVPMDILNNQQHSEYGPISFKGDNK